MNRGSQGARDRLRSGAASRRSPSPPVSIYKEEPHAEVRARESFRPPCLTVRPRGSDPPSAQSENMTATARLKRGRRRPRRCRRPPRADARSRGRRGRGVDRGLLRIRRPPTTMNPQLFNAGSPGPISIASWLSLWDRPHANLGSMMNSPRWWCPLLFLAMTACGGPGAPTKDALDAARREIPAGSSDYSYALADATLYKEGAISFDELEARVLARHLPPHPLGDGYLMMVPPPPPAGADFTPLSMPRDWEHTWGEIAMTHFAGKITKEEYDRLHTAAHPACKDK